MGVKGIGSLSWVWSIVLMKLFEVRVCCFWIEWVFVFGDVVVEVGWLFGGDVVEGMCL